MRQGVDTAVELKTECRQGVRGTTWGHALAEDGSTKTLETEIVILNNHHARTAIIAIESPDEVRDALDTIARSLRFSDDVLIGAAALASLKPLRFSL